MASAVSPIKPVITFGLRLQAGYVYRFPLKPYSGERHVFTVLTTITPESTRTPVHLIDHLRLPMVPETTADGESGGSFLLGEGRYSVNWLLMDDGGRKCVKSWQIDALPGRGERALRLTMPTGSVADLSLRGAAPPQPSSPEDQELLLGSLSAVMARVPASSVRLIVFNLEQQRELLRRDDFTLAETADVARTLNELKLGKIDLGALRTGHLDLLASMVNEESKANRPPDKVIFLGPPERFHDKVPAGRLVPGTGSAPAFLYLKCRAPQPVNGGIAGDRGSDVASGVLDERTAWVGVKDNPTAEQPVRSVIPSAPEHMSDTVSLLVGELKGKLST